MAGHEPLADKTPDPISGTVLCIEDHPVSLVLIEHMLASFSGVTVLKAMTGREGVDKALTERPDLILLDMSLPDIGGLEVVRMLCNEISRHTLSVVLVTADTLSIDVIKALSLGAREYWMKPLTIEKLHRDLPRALRRAQADRLRSRSI